MTIRRMRFARWITKAINTRYVILIAFHDDSGYTNAAQCYVIRTLRAFVSAVDPVDGDAFTILELLGQ